MRKVRPLEQTSLACWRERRNDWHDPRIWLTVAASIVILSILGFKIARAAMDAGNEWRDRDMEFSKIGSN